MCLLVSDFKIVSGGAPVQFWPQVVFFSVCIYIYLSIDSTHDMPVQPQPPRVRV